MNKISNYIKLYIKDIFLPIITGVFFIYFNYKHFSIVKDENLFLYFGNFGILKQTLELSLLCFVFFLFISYYYFDKLRHDSLFECACVTSRGVFGIYLRQFFIMLSLAVIFTLTAVAYNLYAYIAYNINRPEIMGAVYPAIPLHILGCILLYIFGASLVAVLFGLVLALTMKRLGACITMLVSVFLVSPAFTICADILALKYNIDIFPFAEFINIFPRNLIAAPQCGVGFSLLPDIIASVIFFTALFIIPIIIKTVRKNKVKCISTVLCVIICVSMLGIYAIPGAHTLSDRNPNTFYLKDLLYYEDKSPVVKTENGGFDITKYEMNLSVKNDLKADVKMFLDNSSLSSYKFTLHHDFKIKNIKDQNDEKLSFVREGDYVEVKPGKNPLTSVTFSYRGYNPSFYANRQGISLLGNFPYFPRSGYIEIYDVVSQGFYKNDLNKPADFTVHVDYNKEVFSNLQTVDRNTFSGSSTNCVLAAGFLTETEIEGIDVIYAYPDVEEFSREGLQNDVKHFLKHKKDDKKLNKIIVIPFKQHYGDYISCYYPEGTVVCEQGRSLDTEYPKSMVNDSKLTLFKAYYSYTNHRNDFDNRLMYEIEMYEKILMEEGKEKKGEAVRLQELIDAIGEEEALARVKEYIYDDSDTRSVDEFLTQEIKNGKKEVR